MATRIISFGFTPTPPLQVGYIPFLLRNLLQNEAPRTCVAGRCFILGSTTQNFLNGHSGKSSCFWALSLQVALTAVKDSGIYGLPL